MQPGGRQAKGDFLTMLWATVGCQLFKVCSLPAAQMQPEMYQRGRGESLTIPEPQQKKNLHLPLPGSMILGHVNQASMFSSEEKKQHLLSEYCHKNYFLKHDYGGWKNSSTVKSTYCSCRRPDFNSKYPCWGWGR